MKIVRRFTTAGTPVEEQIVWKRMASHIEDMRTGKVIHHQDDVEVPEQWSQTATNMLSQKYFRKRGVPTRTIRFNSPEESDMPGWIQRSIPAMDAEYIGETSGKQAFHRLAGCWTYWAWKMGLIKDGVSARNYYDEMYWMLAMQYAAPNSPQWFNTGLHWAYGIEGPDSGQWTVLWDGNIADGVTYPYVDRVYDSYSRPQPHACFIQPVQDDLVNEGGIMDLWVREARLFKHGSGTGTNFSSLRGEGEGLSGGGRSSGLMSFLQIGDRAAGSIKSGGTTRRAAKMVCIDVDHPDIGEFIEWKSGEENKASDIAVGSKVTARHLRGIHEAVLRWGTSSVLYKERVNAARDDGVPDSIINRVRYAAERDEPFKWEVYEANSWEGVPIETVSGQNANNSIRITSKFLQAVDEDKPWDLIARTTGKPMKTVSAKGLWDKIVRAAWTTADPGMQFHDVINDWHTCKADGDINASNPCSEYMFLDDTACNLASLNLVKFRGSNGGVDVNAYIHALRLWTVTLDISIQMASFPSRNIAHNTMQYRTLGLGYANLGGLLMRSGIPYDSEVGRNFAAALTSLMTAVAYSTSAEMAGEIGPFPAWERNKHYMAVVMGMHAAALDGLQTDEWSGQLLVAAQRYWSLVVNDAGTVGFRNAQGTLLAPTGTIGLLMDVDTTGCEPETSLVRYKNYAGGGSDKFVCQAVEEGLIKLGYNGDHLKAVLKFVEENGHLAVATENHVAGIWSEHLPVFDCALDRKETTRYIRPMAHIEMLAAIQPFLSGAASKTCNLPETATYEDVDMLYRAAERLKCKAVALYRNNCKLTQPVQTEQQPAVERPDDQPFIPETDLVRHTSIEELRAERTHSNGHDKTNGSMQRGERKYPPNRRYGPAQKVRINDQVIHIRTSEYPDDHSFAEVFVDMGKDGSMLQAVLGQWAKAVSLARQYGAPTEKLVESFLHTRFEPAGFVQEHDHIKSCTSVIDLVAREIGFTYLKRMDLVQVPPDTDHAMHFNPVAFQPQHQTEHSSLMGTAGVVASPVRMVASGNACSVCGNEMEWDGTCLRCRRCGNNTGCGS